MNEFLSGRPGDERAFLHKTILGGIAKVGGFLGDIGVPGAGTVATVARRLRGNGGGGGSAFTPFTPIVREEKRRATEIKFADLVPLGFNFGNGNGNGGCPVPLVMAPDGHCVAPGSGHARSHGIGGTRTAAELGVGGPVGDAVMGRYGAALVPGSRIIDRAVCLKGMQLGDDGLCYNKSQISNKQRMWPAGRKPLLTGGDMRAISTAARAGRRLEGATKRLQRMGMMKKPASRRGPTQHQRLLEAHVTK